MSNTPRVKTLDGIELGSGYPARLVAALIRHHNDTHADTDVSDALHTLAMAFAAGEWTVYRWLRGISTPRRITLRVMAEYAAQRGVTVDEEDPQEDPKGALQSGTDAA